jgi:hypothetical protein
MITERTVTIMPIILFDRVHGRMMAIGTISRLNF